MKIQGLYQNSFISVNYLTHVKLIALALVILMISSLPMAMGHNSNHYEFKFQFAKISVDGQNSAINISMNSSAYIELSFNKIYVGSLNLIQFPRFYYGDLKGMNVTQEYNYSKDMGNYLHIQMWKNTKLIRFGWGKTYTAKVILDFYVASKNYTKKSIEVDRNTLRYDVRIYTDCPDDFIYLSHRINTGGFEKENVFSKEDHHWDDVDKTMGKKWMNFTCRGNLGFGTSPDNLSFIYLWNATNVNSIYSYWDNHVDLFFVYQNTGTVSQDPYVKLPVPIFTNTTEIPGKVVNYFMDHTLSISIGIGVAAAIISIPVLINRRKLSL